MSNTFLTGGHQKSRTLSGEVNLATISELRPSIYKAKYSSLNPNKSQKPRHKSILIEKERLYEENLQLKLMSNTLLEENIKLKTRLQQNENDFKKTSEKLTEKDFKGSSLMFSLKYKIKELKNKNMEITEQYNQLKSSIKATRVMELEEEAKQYFNQCWRLKKLLEETSRNSVYSQKSTKNDEEKISNQKIQQKDGIFQQLYNENKKYKEIIEDKDKEIKELRDKIRKIMKNGKNSRENAKKNEKISEKSFENGKISEISAKASEKREKLIEKNEKYSLKLKFPEKNPEPIVKNEKKPEEPVFLNKPESKDIEKSESSSENYDDFDPTPKVSVQKTFQRGVTTVKHFEDSRDLKRELNPNASVLIDSFFRKLYWQINSRGISLKDFVACIDPSGKNELSLEEIYENLVKNEYNLLVSEVKSVAEALEKIYNKKTVSINIVLEKLQGHEADSNRSYEISSEGSVENENVFAIDSSKKPEFFEVKFEDISHVFEYLFIFISSQNIERNILREFLMKKLMNDVDYESLEKTFLDKKIRIEDGVERNKMSFFLIGEQKRAKKEEICEKFLKCLFGDEEEMGEEEKNNVLVKVVDEIKEKKEEFLEMCKSKDKNDRKLLSWKEIKEVLLSLYIELNKNEENLLKIKCFKLENSLNIIPYEDIFTN